MKKQPRYNNRATVFSEKGWWKEAKEGINQYGHEHPRYKLNSLAAKDLCESEEKRKALSEQIARYDNRFFIVRWAIRLSSSIEKQRALLYYYNTTQDIERLEAYKTVTPEYKADVKAVLGKLEQRSRRISWFSHLRNPLKNLRNVVRTLDKAARESVEPPPEHSHPPVVVENPVFNKPSQVNKPSEVFPAQVKKAKDNVSEPAKGQPVKGSSNVVQFLSVSSPKQSNNASSG